MPGFARWIAAAPLLLPPALAAQPTAAPPEAAEGAPLLFDTDRYRRMTVPVSVGEAGPFRFFIDTGAQNTILTGEVVSAAGLAPDGRAQLVALGSSRLVDTVTVDGVRFAGRTVDGLLAPILERAHVGADGILGLDSLQNLRVQIDFADDSMTVADSRVARRRDDEYDIVVRARRRHGQMIIVNALVDGVRAAVVIDTGAQHTIGNPALLARLKARDAGEQQSRDVHGALVTSRLGTVRHLRIGNMTLGGLTVGFAPSPAFAALALDDRPALLLGMENLRLFERVAIDFAARRILFDAPGTVRRAGHAPSRREDDRPLPPGSRSPT